MGSNRIHFMDSMRSVLMMLGVVIHSFQVYNPRQSWVIYSNDSTVVAYWVVKVLITFRMPAFFMISGFFALITINKKE